MHIRKSSKNLKLSLIQILCLSCQFGLFFSQRRYFDIFNFLKNPRERKRVTDRERRERERESERERGGVV